MCWVFPATEHGNDIHDLWVTPADLTLAKCPEVLARLTPTTTPVLRDVSAEDEAERNCRKRRRGLEGPFVRYCDGFEGGASAATALDSSAKPHRLIVSTQ